MNEENKITNSDSATADTSYDTGNSCAAPGEEPDTEPKRESLFKRIGSFIRNSPLAFKILGSLALLCGIIHIICNFSTAVSDFMIQYPNAAVRWLLAHMTSFLPFSLAEMLVFLIPVIFITMVVIGWRLTVTDQNERYRRYLAGLMSVLCTLYSLFVLTLAPGYKGSSLADKIGLEQKAVSADELYETTVWLNGKVSECIKEIDFDANGQSVLPYSLNEMNDRINDAYKKLSAKYTFVSDLRSNIKFVVLSEPMTYTHISGIYTYYTGEANLNVNFPDYHLPFTAAHEFAHQRGTAPENEANFVAFLACMESDDPYILYSAYVNMLDYCMDALYSADYDKYVEVYGSLDRDLIAEFGAYSEFYNKYRKNIVATVSGAVNDTYLKSQGQKAGSRSYGLVVDLAVAYYNENIAEQID